MAHGDTRTTNRNWKVEDCIHCKFLGVHKGYDVYECGEEVIMRFGDSPEQYLCYSKNHLSYLLDTGSEPIQSPRASLYRFAKNMMSTN